jgi:hypothetical protein
MIESSSVITNIRMRGTTQERITVLAPYLDMKFWRFKFGTFGIRERDVVIWVKNPTWYILCSNACLRYTYKLKGNMKESTLEVKSFTTKEDTIIKICTMWFIPSNAMLVRWWWYLSQSCCTMIFMTPRVKICVRGLGIEVYVKTRFLHFWNW